MTLSELSNAFISAGATEAINFDGGGSTQFYAPNGNHFTGRNVRGFIGIWLTKSEDIRTVNVKTSLNVRSGASAFTAKVGSLKNGDVVKVLEEKIRMV